MQSRIAAIVGGACALGILTFGLGTQCASPPPSAAMVDSLHAVNGELTKRNTQLALDYAALTLARDSVVHGRDSLLSASHAATTQIQAQRATLPPAGTVADTSLRPLYAEALRQLDTAVAELSRKDRIIRQDSVIIQQGLGSEVNLRLQVRNLTIQYSNEQQVSAEWVRQLKAKDGRCGVKCGIVLGVLGTVGTAVGVKQVQDLLSTRR